MITVIQRASMLERIVDDVTVDEHLPGIRLVNVSDGQDGQRHDRSDCANGSADSERSVL